MAARNFTKDDAFGYKRGKVWIHKMIGKIWAARFIREPPPSDPSRFYQPK